MSAKILLLDIETAPSLGYVWGKYDQNVIAFKENWFLLCFGYKWAHEPLAYVHALCDYPDYKKGSHDDRRLAYDLWHLLDEADIVVAHNGDAFDIKKVNTRFLVHGLDAPSTYKTVDTLKIVRKHFKFESNKLDDLGPMLGLGEKAPSGGMKTWFGCMEGDPEAWEKMKGYNVQDVYLLDSIHLKVRGWSATYPNVNLYEARKTAHLCPCCSSKNVQRRGFQHANSFSYQRWQCQDCGKWYKGPRIKKDEL
jgi:hypothetical protein